jgi:hypothetical protein
MPVVRELLSHEPRVVLKSVCGQVLPLRTPCAGMAEEPLLRTATFSDSAVVLELVIN